MQPELRGLELADERQLRKVHHVRFQQTHEDIPVYEAQYLVHLREDGRIVMANGTYYPKIDAPTTPRLSDRLAQQVALNDLEGEPKREEITGALMIYPEQQFHLAWRLEIPIEPFGGWVYFVDAQDGAILEKQNQLTHVVGDGKVYPEHPNRTSTAVKNLYRLGR